LRLLVLTFYFPPDLSAGSFRADSLVRALRETAPPASEIEVVTTAPNRYASFTGDAVSHEVSAGVSVTRFDLPSHRSDISGQSRAFLSFAKQVRTHVAGRDYDLVFATSSRLMTAALGAAVARKKGVPLFLDIRDIFVDTISELLPLPAVWLLKPILSAVEARTMRSASRINLVSRGFKENFEHRYPDATYSWFTNGIDEEFVDADLGAHSSRSSRAPITILYAVNIGAGQALHEIVPDLARALEGRAKLVVIGDGGRRTALEKAVSGLGNVELRSPISREELLEAYREADALFLHLGRFAAFEKVLPSKLFEYAALGKPILAGVSGFSADFIREEISNAAVFNPGDAEGAVSALQRLDMVTAQRRDFVTKYRRRNISLAMAAEIWATANAV